LNPEKLISKKELIYFVEHQMKARKMSISNNFLMNNDYLERLFLDHRARSPMAELPDLVEKLLEPV
jgi:hypothetical protein